MPSLALETQTSFLMLATTSIDLSAPDYFSVSSPQNKFESLNFKFYILFLNLFNPNIGKMNNVPVGGIDLGGGGTDISCNLKSQTCLSHSYLCRRSINIRSKPDKAVRFHYKRELHASSSLLLGCQTDLKRLTCSSIFFSVRSPQHTPPFFIVLPEQLWGVLERVMRNRLAETQREKESERETDRQTDEIAVVSLQLLSSTSSSI